MTRQFLARILTSVVVAVASVSLGVASFDAEAKRLGGGRPAGMQRQMPAKHADGATPAKPATPNVAPGQNAAAPAQPAPGMPPAAQPAKRSWMGPLAGLAAGLGIAALASHFGFGEQLGNFMMMAMLAVVVMVAMSWLMRRLRGGNAAPQGPQLAVAGAPYPSPSGAFQPTPMAREALGGQPPAAASGLAAGSGAAAPAAQPEAFDAEAFTRTVKMIFIRMQAVNDAGNVEDLRKFTTPELFASLRLDLQERGATPQQTDVVQLDATLLDIAQEGGQWVASVRFKGLIREEADQGALPFTELWHFVRPLTGSTDWAIAGITPEAV